MEEQLELLNKLENDGIIFQEFEPAPTCIKCDHADVDLEGRHEVRYVSGIWLTTDEEGNEEHVGFEHLKLTCPTCGYSFRSLTKDIQEAYEESREAEESLGEDEGELGDISEDGVAIADLARRVAEDNSPFPQPKKPSKLTKMFFEEKKEE
ncbi:hypothetical protein LCGC14_0985870 [marine sediment metagenome]|uniref:Uncharacterized protein n=1 Tax=marine sediment metagenome TaxID=412755 RepID=A0A0F9NTR6_9ZZZZ